MSLSWTAATDNVGVTGYRVERCQGAGCTTSCRCGADGADATATGASGVDDVSLSGAGGGCGGKPGAVFEYGQRDDAPDTTPPTAPNGLTATAPASSQVNLSWAAATDNVGVTGYRVERCQGAGCTTFMEIATPTGTTYSDGGLSLDDYSYRCGRWMRRGTWARIRPSRT